MNDSPLTYTARPVFHRPDVFEVVRSDGIRYGRSVRYHEGHRVFASLDVAKGVAEAETATQLRIWRKKKLRLAAPDLLALVDLADEVERLANRLAVSRTNGERDPIIVELATAQHNYKEARKSALAKAGRL